MVATVHFFRFDHPSSQGHFPGNPIIPGAALLSETLRAIEASLGLSLSPGRIVSAKFLHPARPGDRVAIEFSDSAAGTIKFACTVGPTTVLAGVVTCGALSALA